MLLENNIIELYSLIVGVLLEILALWVLVSRLLFVRNAHSVLGIVTAKVLRNYSAETLTGKSKHLKIEYKNLHDETCEYICDNSLMTHLYAIGEDVSLSIGKSRILINSILYIVLAPFFISVLGMGTLSIYFRAF